MGPTKVPWVGVAGPRTRLLWEEGVAVARLIRRDGRHAGRKDRQLHGIQAVQQFVEEVPVHPLCQPEGEKAPFPQAGGPPVRAAPVGGGLRRVVEAKEPTPPGGAPVWAVARDVSLVLVRSAAVGARGARLACRGGPTAPARSPRSSDFSNSVEAARGAARQDGPSAQFPSPPKVTGR